MFFKKSGISEPKYLESIKIKDYDLMNRQVNLLGHTNRNMQEKLYDRNPKKKILVFEDYYILFKFWKVIAIKRKNKSDEFWAHFNVNTERQKY